MIRYSIYVIVGAADGFKAAYVGKSKNASPREQLSSHKTGRVQCTAAFFGPDGLCAEPHFYVLEILDCTKELASKHVAAWCAYFDMQGYECLNTDPATRMPDRSDVETWQIFEAYCEPFEPQELFTREVRAKGPPRQPLALNSAKGSIEQLRSLCALASDPYWGRPTVTGHITSRDGTISVAIDVPLEEFLLT